MSAGDSSQTAADLLLRELRSFADDARNLPVVPTMPAAGIRDRLAPYTFAHAVSLSHVLHDVADLLRHGTLHGGHPRYFGLFVPNAHEAGVWADALAAVFNPQLGAWWHAPAATEIESHTLAYLARIVGFDARAAHFTSGGSEANLTALLAAIATAFPDAADAGAGDAAARGVVYVSSQAHHSVHKAVRITGLGNRALRVVACNARHQMDIGALHAALAADVAAGRKPLMIVGTAGATTSGAIDDLQAIARASRAYDAWFHVDAAWGGAAGFSKKLRQHLRGIDQADSLTWDAHKWLSVPMGAGMFFCRRPGALSRLFDVDASYVPKEVDEGDDLYLRSLQWSRRFIGLKVFLTLAAVGQDGVEARIDRQAELADYARRRLQAGGWAIVNETPLPVVCFTHPALGDPASLAGVAQRIASGGRAWISAAALPEGPVLRACITHDHSTPADVDVLCEELAAVLPDPDTRNRARR